MGVSIQVDRFTPYLIERLTGKIVETKYQTANRSDLKGLQKQGRNFDWTADDLKGTAIYKLMTEDGDTIQGLVAVMDMPTDYAVYLKLAESAPCNLGKNRQFGGVLPALAQPLYLRRPAVELIPDFLAFAVFDDRALSFVRAQIAAVSVYCFFRAG